MKKVLSIVLSLVMVLCMVPTMAFADSAVYSDIEGEACEASVELLTELGVVDGYEDGTYQPAAVVTRAEMAKLIVTQLGLNPTSSTTSFTDMDAAKWAIPHVGYAESLGIIKGYGDGRFGPNDTVTYDEVVTMIVRAIGYTEACNEMQGQWPAVFVQKANELGILKNIATTGDTGANRGDVAIMLANALYVPLVYADNEGATKLKLNEAGFEGVTMMDTLVKDADDYYGVVTAENVNNATKNIAGLLGAAGKIVINEGRDVISVSDIKSTFMTGEFNEAGTKFTVDSVEYKVPADALKGLNSKGKPAEVTTYNVDEEKYVPVGVPVFDNGVTSDSAITVSSTPADLVAEVGTDDNVTLACIVDGKTITAIFSAQVWELTDAAKVDESDLADIVENKSLLGYDFATDVNGEINENIIVLDNITSLDEIAEDDVVYVYANDEDKITKVQVCNETVSGVVDKIVNGDTFNDNKYTVDGTVYKVAKIVADDIYAPLAGEEVEISLGYDGKIFDMQLVEGTANFAVVVSKTSAHDSGKLPTGLDASTSKIKLMTADGATIYNVAASKYNKNIDNSKATGWDGISDGDIVKYYVNDSSEITRLIVIGSGGSEADGYTLNGPDADKKITAKGYVDSNAIADNAVIFAAPVDDADAPTSFVCTDSDKLAVVSKDDILDVTAELLTTVVDDKTNKVVAMIISDESSADSVFGIATSLYDLADSKDGVDFYIGDELMEGVLSGTEPLLIAKAKDSEVLYKINKTAAGEYTFEAVDATHSTDAAITSDKDEVTVSGKTISINGNKIADMSEDVVVYVYDVSDEEYKIGGTSDLRKDFIELTVYINKEANNDDKGLIDFIVIYRD